MGKITNWMPLTLIRIKFVLRFIVKVGPLRLNSAILPTARKRKIFMTILSKRLTKRISFTKPFIHSNHPALISMVVTFKRENMKDCWVNLTKPRKNSPVQSETMLKCGGNIKKCWKIVRKEESRSKLRIDWSKKKCSSCSCVLNLTKKR